MIRIGKFKRTVTKQFDPKNYKSGVTSNAYGANDKKIKKTKTIVIETPKKTKVKTVNYGPIDYYGKQLKTKVITKRSK